jgi:hypothetical protein
VAQVPSGPSLDSTPHYANLKKKVKRGELASWIKQKIKFFVLNEALDDEYLRVSVSLSSIRS